MATSQQILDDINLRYRNSFTTDQKLVWFNEEQQELFDVLELDSPPYTFQTVAGENFYPFPQNFDVTKIKTVTFQTSDADTGHPFVEVPFLRNDDRQGVLLNPWYTIVSNAMYLWVSSETPDDRTVYIYCDSDPIEVTSSNLNVAPSLPVRFQELLKLGVLKRIAAARKDAQMKSNYESDYEQKLADIMWQKKLAEPEWTSPIDMNYKPIGGAYFRGFPWVSRS